MNKSIDKYDVFQALTQKIHSLECAMKDMCGQADLVNEARRSLFAVRCLVSALQDEEILLIADWILNHMQNGFYYDRHQIILAASDLHFLGDVNAAMSVLESSGIIGRRTVNNTDTVYLAEMHHAWIVSELGEESNEFC